MIQISELRDKIRKHSDRSKACKNYFYKDQNRKVKAVFDTTMYLLQDSTESLHSHRQKNFSNDPHKAYIEFWGIMQAVIIQQDCICELHKIYFDEKLKPPTNGPWAEIRSLRDLMAGHPISHKKNRYSFMGRNFGNYSSIRYEQYDATTGKTHHPTIDLGKLIDDYENYAVIYLERIYDRMQRFW